MKQKVTIDANACIGCGACCTSTTNIEMKEVNGDMKAVPKRAEIEENEVSEHQEAVDICPVDAIKLEEIKKDD